MSLLCKVCKSYSSNEEFRFVKKREISKLVGLSPQTLKKYRLDCRLTEGIHWIRVNSRLVLYNSVLMQDWIQNIHSPHVHQIAIERYLKGLKSSQRKVR